jgi:tetratricopeptide (TPR) repeat protein
MIKHLSYFEVLAGLEETDAEWNPTAAGLVTLRLVDNWQEYGAASMKKDVAGVSAVRDVILKIGPGNSARSLLGDIVTAVMKARGIAMDGVTPCLVAYARVLDVAGHWLLASDVFGMIAEYVDPVDDPDTVIEAHMRRGYCFRMLGKWDLATEAYAEAGSLAAASEDLVMVVRARIGDAKIASDRGNLPLAEEILNDAIDRSGSPRLTEVRAIALQDRADVAHRKGEYQKAIRDGYEALEGLTQSILRDRALHDIASSFMELGVLSAARDAFLLLAATAEEQYVRWMSTINLMDIASRDLREEPFEMYAREMADAALPALLLAQYHICLGRGYRIFGQFDLAQSAMDRALEIATEHSLSQLIFKAEQEMTVLKEQSKERQTATLAQPPDDLVDVVAAIRDMRVTAGVALD